MIASDQDSLVSDIACNSVSNDIFRLGVAFFMRQMPFGGGSDYCIGNRMRKMFFQAGRQTEHFIFFMAAECDNLRNLRRSISQCSGFVKQNRICLRNRLQETAALDSNADLTAFTHS